MLPTCLACLSNENVFNLNSRDLYILAYLLNPFSKTYLESLKSKNLNQYLKICNKCRVTICNIDTFRNIILKNGLKMCRVSEFQEDKPADPRFNNDPIQVSSLHDNKTETDSNAALAQNSDSIETTAPVKIEHPSPESLLHEEIEIKLEEDDNNENVDEVKPAFKDSDINDHIKLERHAQIEHEHSDLSKVTTVNVKVEDQSGSSETTLNDEQSITYHTYNPPEYPVLERTWSTTSRNKYLNPSLKYLPGKGLKPRLPGPTRQYLPSQGQTLMLSPQLAVPGRQVNTVCVSGSQPPPLVQLGKLFVRVKTVPSVPGQTTTSNQASCVVKTVNELAVPVPQSSQKEKKKKNRVVYRDLPLKYECTYCGKKYKAKDNLRIHIEHVHMGITVTCSICDRTLKKHNLKLHMRQHEDAVYCQPCDKWYCPASYKVHVTSTAKHLKPEEFKFPCEDCGMKFHQRTYLRRHMNRVHLKAEKGHKCSKCPKAFEGQGGLNRHFRDVHLKRERPRNYVCDICGVGMYNKASLSAHMVRHTGARPYKCSVCDATFGYKAALFTHNKLKHDQKQRAKNVRKKRRTKVKVEKEDRVTASAICCRDTLVKEEL